MDKFRDAVEGYCEYQAQNQCDKCAIHAACHIANPEQTPEGMSDRDIEILFNVATDMYKELVMLLDTIREKET